MTPDQALDILGVARRDGRDAALRAYRAGIRRHRPEVDPAGFRRVREAWEALDRLPDAFWRDEPGPARGDEPSREAGAGEAGGAEAPARQGAPPAEAARDAAPAPPDVLDALPPLDPDGRGAVKHAVRALEAAGRALDTADALPRLVAAFHAWGRCRQVVVHEGMTTLLVAHLAPSRPREDRLAAFDAAADAVGRAPPTVLFPGAFGGLMRRASMSRSLWGLVDPDTDAALHRWLTDGDDQRLHAAIQWIGVQRPAAFREDAALAARVALPMTWAFGGAPDAAGERAGAAPSSEGWSWSKWFVVFAVVRGLLELFRPDTPVDHDAGLKPALHGRGGARRPAGSAPRSGCCARTLPSAHRRAIGP